MDIDQNIDDLVIKYEIDTCNDMYRKGIQAKEIIRTSLKKFQEIDKKILLLSDNVEDFEEIEKVIKDYIEFDMSNFLLIKRNDALQIDDMSNKFEIINSYDIILIISFNKHNELYFDVKNNCKKDMLVCDLYEEFVKEKLYFNCEFYKVGHYIHDYYKDIFFDKQNYKNSTCREYRKHYLEQIILDHIIIRDFLNVKRWIDRYIKEDYSKGLRYIEFWNELDNFLNSLKEKILLRNQYDIIIEWLDSLELKDLMNMPFINQKKEDNLFLSNAGNISPNTVPVAYEMFMGVKLIDDHSFELRSERIGIDNSQRLQSLISKGYYFLFMGHSSNKIFKPDCTYQTCGGEWIPISLNHWNLLKVLLKEDRPCVIILQSMETHPPCMSPSVEDSFYEYDKKGIGISLRDVSMGDYSKDSIFYADEQIEYYMNFLNNNNTKIYMSDHGRTSYFERWRSVLIIESANIKKGICEEMFSLINFDKLMNYILNPTKESFENMFSEYIELQDVTRYGMDYKRLIQHPHRIMAVLGYRGLCTKEEKYIKRDDGKAFYYRFPNNINLINNKEYYERIKYLKSLISDYKIDVNKYERFENSKIIIKAVEFYCKRFESYQKDINRYLIELVKTFDKEKKIAIRGAGEHTEKLIKIIKDYVNISFIIDKNVGNILQEDGYCYIKPEDMNKYNIDIVIISSYYARHAIKDELLMSEIKYEIIDIYEYLNKHNIELIQPFYGNEILEEIDFKNAYTNILLNNKEYFIQQLT